MEKIEIHSFLREYSVSFSDSSLLPSKSSSFYFLDSNIYHLWKDVWKDKNILILPSGEECKNIEVYIKAIQWLEDQQAGRSSQITAVGGGALLDCAGFVASTYLRGIEWNAVPTTLLSMVDSCIGGKVGINFTNHKIKHKNRIGQFYPPFQVWICDQWLTTLPKREFQSGYAEVIKMAALAEGLFWKECLDYSLLTSIQACLKYKALVVEKDEFEKNRESGRFVLNAGHTIAHGLESMYPGRFLHGESVSIGLVLETEFGVKNFSSGVLFFKELKQKLQSMGLPVDLPKNLDLDKFIKILLKDKKGDGNSLAMSIIEAPGKCKIVLDISVELFKKFLREKVGVSKI